MTVRSVLTLAELDRGQRCESVGVIDQRVIDLATDLRDTMRASPACVGLAAPQIGVNSRAFIVDVSDHKKTQICHGEIILFDPQIMLAESPERAREGCMSVPDLTGDVSRATRISLNAMTIEGESVSITTNAFEARAILHEIDHLDGLVFLDRLSGPNALHARRVYR